MKVEQLSSDEYMEGWLHEIRGLAQTYGTAKGKRVELEQFRKVKKAMLMRRYENLGFEAANKQEREAYADPEYLELVIALGEATAQEAQAFWDLKLAEWKFEWWRSREATKRQEKTHYRA